MPDYFYVRSPSFDRPMPCSRHLARQLLRMINDAPAICGARDVAVLRYKWAKHGRACPTFDFAVRLLIAEIEWEMWGSF